MMNHQKLIPTFYTVRSHFQGNKLCLVQSRFLSSSSMTRKGRKTRFLSLSTTASASASTDNKVAATAEAHNSSSNNKNILPLSFVLSPAVKTILPVLGNFSYVAVASGFLMTDMLLLRVALVGGYSGLVMFHMMHPRPLRIPLRWSALFVVLNSGAACALAADRYAAPLSKDDEDLYIQHFSAFLSRGQFHQLLSLGTREDFPDGQVLTEEDSVCQYVYFIEKGKAKVYHHKAYTANIDQGGFVNDVAFGRGENVGAYGTVVTSGQCSVLKWDQSTLRNHLRSRPEMNRNMKYCLSDHLVQSLLRQREAAHMRQGQQWSAGAGAVGDVSTVPWHQLRISGTIRRSPSEREITWDEHNKSKDTASR